MDLLPSVIPALSLWESEEHRKPTVFSLAPLPLEMAPRKAWAPPQAQQGGEAWWKGREGSVLKLWGDWRGAWEPGVWARDGYRTL